MKKVQSGKAQVKREDSGLSTFHFPLSTVYGFTLVEMLVAIAVFMVVAVIAVAALLKIVDANRLSRSLQDTVNNVNFVMDDMTRELRVANAYYCQSGSYSGDLAQDSKTNMNCNTSFKSQSQPGGISIAFLSSDTAPSPSGPCYMTYAYDFVPLGTSPQTWTIDKAQQDPTKQCGDNLIAYTTTNPGSYEPIMDPSVVITGFNIQGNVPSVGRPSILLYISGYSGTTTTQRTYFDIQTTISERD